MPAPEYSLLTVGVLPAQALAGAHAWRVAQADDLRRVQGHDAVLLWASSLADLQALCSLPGLNAAAFECALVVCSEVADDAAEQALLRLGVEAIVPAGTSANAGAELLRALRHAVQRKQMERLARTAYATDLATGLPHQAQLVEHMTQLLALREREPAPMVLLVLRVDGFAQAAAKLGMEAGNVLRRKVAVRLRSALRASDVVAAMGPDAFGVLLGRLEARADGERVAAKLVKSLQLPLSVAGQPCSVTAVVGLAQYPEHGKDAQSLMQRATAQAGSVATMGAAGFAGMASASVHRIGGAAANED